MVENVCSLNHLSSNSCSPPVLMIIEVAAAAQRCVALDERGACDCVDERGACDRPTCATVQSGAMHLNASIAFN